MNHRSTDLGIHYLSTLSIPSTRPSESRTLSFRSGLSSRPLLLDTPAADISAQISTRVPVFISDETYDQLLTIYSNSRLFMGSWKLTIEQLVGALCPMIDVDVFVRQGTGKAFKVHSQNWAADDHVSWLRRVTLADIRNDSALDEIIRFSAKQLRPVDADNVSLGLSTIAYRPVEAGASTIGGLRAGRQGAGAYDESFVGTMDLVPDGPQRSFGRLAAAGNKIGEWASDQAKLIALATQHPIERHRTAVEVIDFGGDPLPVASMNLNRVPTNISNIVSVLKEGRTLLAPLRSEPKTGGDGEILLIWRVGLEWRHFSEALGQEELEFVCPTLEVIYVKAHHQKFYAVPRETDKAEYSFLDCLKRLILDEGLQLEIELKEDAVMAKYVGLGSDRHGIKQGAEIRGQCLQIQVPRMVSS